MGQESSKQAGRTPSSLRQDRRGNLAGAAGRLLRRLLSGDISRSIEIEIMYVRSIDLGGCVRPAAAAAVARRRLWV